VTGSKSSEHSARCDPGGAIHWEKLGCMLETLGILRYSRYDTECTMSDNARGVADNQQGSPLTRFFAGYDPSETTRRAPFTQEEIIGYFQGALHDASLNKGKRYRFVQKDRRWLEILSIFLGGLGFKSWIYKEGKHRNVYTLETLAPFLDFESDPEVFYAPEARRGYIRGFFDAEGGIPHHRTDRFYVQFVQKDRVKLQKLTTLLHSMSIVTGAIHNPSRRKNPDYWRFYIATGSHEKFLRDIGSWHPTKISILRERMMI
jgi:hypothetical protein